jgi:transcriptional regulator with XRE-family HTH domain
MSGMPDTAAHDNADDVGMSRGKHALLIKLGERIKRLRKRKGYTQTDLTVHLDMNRGHLSDIERGKREVGIITLQVIARGLNTTMSNLLRGLWCGSALRIICEMLPDYQQPLNLFAKFFPTFIAVQGPIARESASRKKQRHGDKW